MALPNMALRLANVRRFLDARIPIKLGGEFKDPNDHQRLMEMVRRQSLPCIVREEAKTSFMIVLQEQSFKSANPKEMVLETEPWYILNKESFKTLHAAMKWCKKECQCYNPVVL